MTLCSICKKAGADRKLSEKGYDAFTSLARQLPSSPDIYVGCHVHNKCRSKYVRDLKKGGEDGQAPRASRRHEFNIRLDCFYCETPLLKFTEGSIGLSDREKVSPLYY